MKTELTFRVEVEGDYVPGCAPYPIGGGAWDPGDGPMISNMVVTYEGHDITDWLNVDQLECLEEAWLEDYQNKL